MINHDYKVTAIFRYDKQYGVFVLFPDEEHRPGIVTSYAHCGQHCEADYNHCIRTSRLATPEEYQALASELRSIGYDLQIRKRRFNK